jgi:hypothetical protein
MQELKLVSIDGFAEGGSSKPLLITAIDQSQVPKQYVMKLFKTNNIEQNYSVAKEIFVNELAKEFDLSVPDYAIIKIDHKILSEFFSEEEIERLDKGYKFCSEFMAQYVIFNPLVSLTFIKDYDIENLFCFDNLVLNVDRGGARDKPNLLINDSDILLIDHELTLPFIHNGFENTNYYNYLRTYQHDNHIVKKHLKSLRQKDNLFTEFFESLRFLNVNKFNHLFDEFDNYEIQYGSRDSIFAYLNWTKINISFLNTHLFSIIK